MTVKEHEAQEDRFWRLRAKTHETRKSIQRIGRIETKLNNIPADLNAFLTVVVKYHGFMNRPCCFRKSVIVCALFTNTV